MLNPLLLPMAMHVALTACLYVLLTVLRAPAVWGLGRRSDGSNPWAAMERRVSANLSNQFEWPLFFHAACLLVLHFHALEPVQVWLAWIFLAGRIMHSLIQVLTPQVRLRGLVFTVNFLAVRGMWGRLLLTQAAAGHGA